VLRQRSVDLRQRFVRLHTKQQWRRVVQWAMLLWVHAVEKLCLVQKLLDDKREEAAEAASWWLRYPLEPAPFQELLAAAASCISVSTDGVCAGTFWLLSQALFHFALPPLDPYCVWLNIFDVTDTYMRAHAFTHAFAWCVRVHHHAHQHLSLQCFISRHLMLQDAFRHWQSVGE